MCFGLLGVFVVMTGVQLSCFLGVVYRMQIVAVCDVRF